MRETDCCTYTPFSSSRLLSDWISRMVFMNGIDHLVVILIMVMVMGLGFGLGYVLRSGTCTEAQCVLELLFGCTFCRRRPGPPSDDSTATRRNLAAVERVRPLVLKTTGYWTLDILRASLYKNQKPSIVGAFHSLSVFAMGPGFQPNPTVIVAHSDQPATPTTSL